MTFIGTYIWRAMVLGADLFLTQFLFLLVQLVGCTALQQPLHSSFLLMLGSRATQCRVTEETANCMQHSLLPTVGAEESLIMHESTLCSSSPIPVLMSLECLCTSSPVNVSFLFDFLTFAFVHDW